MNSPSTQYVTPRRLGIYEPIHQMSTWVENFKSNGNPNTSAPIIVEVDTRLDNQVQIMTLILFYLEVEAMFLNWFIFFIQLSSQKILLMDRKDLSANTNKKQVNLLTR